MVFRIVALTKDRIGTYRLWGKMGDEGVDRNFKAQMGEEVKLALFKTFVTAELYTHFPFINIPVSQLDSSSTRLQWKITDNRSQLPQKYKCAEKRRLQKNWDCVARAWGVRIRMLGQEILRNLGQKSFFSFATCQYRQRKLKTSSILWSYHRALALSTTNWLPYPGGRRPDRRLFPQLSRDDAPRWWGCKGGDKFKRHFWESIGVVLEAGGGEEDSK